MKIIDRNLAEQIMSAIKEKIVNLELKPGQRIDLNRLSEEFLTSRMPIRDALTKLEERKLVNAVPRKGYFVVDLSKEDIAKIFELRKLLETFALKKSIFVIKKNELENLVKKIKKAQQIYTTTGDRTLYDKTDKKLHLLIINRCNNKYVSRAFTEIFDLIDTIRHLPHSIERSIQEHLDLIKAMLEKSLDRCLDILERHLDYKRFLI